MSSVFVLNENVCVAAIPKCGQHTLELYSQAVVPEKESSRFKRRIAFIRDPLDRFLSAYYFILGWDKKLDGRHLDSYETFVDTALSSGDEHVLPQTRLIDISKYNEIYSFDKFSSVLESVLGLTPARENQSERYGVDTSYRRKEFEERYKEDFELLGGLI